MRISRGGRDHAEAEAESNGPMDALFRATDAAVVVRGKVTGLRIYAFDDYGMVGKVRITVNFEGRKYVGRGSSPDVVEATAHAYLHAAATRLTDRVPRTSAERSMVTAGLACDHLHALQAVNRLSDVLFVVARNADGRETPSRPSA